MFDPSRYDILTFDQRGCGRSRPFASLDHNTTWDLVRDVRTLCGSCSAMNAGWCSVDRKDEPGAGLCRPITHASAASYPRHLHAAAIRTRLVLSGGASRLFPDKWERYLAPIPPEEHHNLLGAYRRRLTSPIAALSFLRRRAPGLSGRARPERCCPSRVTEGFAMMRLRSHSHVSKTTISFMAAGSVTSNCCCAVPHDFVTFPNDHPGTLRRDLSDAIGLGPVSRLAGERSSTSSRTPVTRNRSPASEVPLIDATDRFAQTLPGTAL